MACFLSTRFWLQSSYSVYVESIATTMVRILILIFLVWLLYQIIKRVAAKANAKPSVKSEQNFVKCAHCGCHVLEAESQLINDKITCNNPECSNQQGNNKPDGA